MADNMTPQEIEKAKKRIDQLDQRQMAGLLRFAPAGHIYFNRNLPLYKYFDERFKKLGGMTPAISKALG